MRTFVVGPDRAEISADHVEIEGAQFAVFKGVDKQIVAIVPLGYGSVIEKTALISEGRSLNQMSLNAAQFYGDAGGVLRS